MAIFTLYYVFFFSSLLYCSATDAIMTNKCISDGETLVSAGEIFQLGFFTPDGSLSSSARYVGIWYYNSTPQTVVWVANRESPLSDRSGIFCVTKYGNLEVQHANKSYWSTELELPLSKTTAELMDTGNLVLRNDTSLEILWDSFSCPTDTFLPGMKMDGKLKLTSWKSRDDPAKGNFTFQRDGVDQFVIQKRVHQFMIGKKSDGWYNYWRSEADGTFLLSIDYLLSNISRKTAAGCGRDYSYPACLPRTNQNDDVGDSKRRLVMSFTGEIQYLRWFDFERNWSLSWWAPGDQCDASDACGKFGSCNSNNGLVCKCLPGFEPRWKDQWESGYFSGGCEPKWPICGLNNGKIIGTFLNLTMMRVKNTDDVSRTATSETECRKECLENCNCQAYSYDDEAEDNSTSTITGVCSFWKDDLSNIQEEYADGGRNLSVRVNVSDIESTPRTCRTCGTNVIPYPLSTQSSCGDLMYSGFHCNITSGQVSFMTYRVTNIDPKLLKFVIQAKGSGNCKGGNSTGEIPKLNKPFQAINRCDNPDPGNHSPVMLSRSRDEIDVSWDQPREPSCNSSGDCWYWPNSNCSNATQGGEKRCRCNAKFQWNGSSLNCTPELPSPTKTPIIIAVTITAAIVLIVVPSTIVYCSRLRRRRAAKRQGKQENIHRNQALHLDDSEKRVKDLLDSDQFTEEDKQGIDVPFFDLKSILAATENFSDANKLGKGGFGPVYKGKFLGGREIAIKKLSNVSGQGIEEFKTEIVLIAKLQHRNLVRLLGYCIEGEEKLLLYEYMPNKSLDSFIFDRTLCVVLDWELRFNIILGIARGLLYLHQDSRLKIIHRDLKTSNILLDEDMNPKISDFGLARIFGGKQIEATTNRVVGTYGYMSPEYANYGFFSIKSDVFSFGVVVLEIISGKKTTGFYQSEEALSLLGYAWRLWNEDKALDLMDRTLFETCNTSEFLKCINVGLLCVQDDPSDRPTMSNVVFMLGSEGATIPAPKKPIFIARRGPSSTTSSSSKPETCSNNELTVTVEEGR